MRTLLITLFLMIGSLPLWAADSPVTLTDPLHRAGIFPLADSASRLSPYYSENAVAERAVFLEWVKRAENGDMDAQYKLGSELISGRRVRRNPARAVFYFRMAGERGHPAALFNLGVCSENGEGIEPSKRFAAECYRMSATEGGILPARYNWALCLKSGLPADREYNLPVLPRDLAEAEKQFAAIADSFPAAKRELALLRLHTRSETDTALRILAELGRNGDPGTLRILGDLALHAIGGNSPDSHAAFRYYSEASKMGDPDAVAKLGWCYENGIGTAVSTTEAFKAYDAAAEAGSTMAMVTLAEAYLHGVHVDTNLDKGLALLVLASRKGDPEAIHRLGTCAYLGIGQNKDLVAAERLFRAAAESHHTQAQYTLALMILEGEIRDATPREAVRWLREAANADHAEAMFAYANCLLKGHGCRMDGESAMYWLRKAARLGHSQANAVIDAIISKP